MVIIKIDSLAKINFDSYEYYTIKGESDPEGKAIQWAKYLGAKELYRFDRPNGILWKVKVV